MPNGAPTRVLIVDDHPLVLSGIRAQLDGAPGVDVVGTAADGQAAIAAAAAVRPDVVVLDISLPDISGFDVARQLQAEHPGARILFLTMHDDEEYVVKAVACGAAGYVLKSAAAGELPRAIQRVTRGLPYFSGDVAQHLVRRYVEGEQRHGGATLAPRERQVLALVAEGHSNKAIAARLGLSVRTVQTYRERIMRKLDLHSVADLTRYALAEGIARL